MNDAIRDRLLKLLTLADRGIGGEKTNARKALEAAMRKHGVAMSDLTEAEPKMRAFKYRGVVEHRLLGQIMVAVCGAKTIIYTSRVKRATLLAKMTPEQRIEIELLWTAHRRQFLTESSLLFSAYLHRHKLFPRDGESIDEEPTQEQRDRIRRMVLMMAGMEPVEVRKQLCTG
jgi:hypothetical protein